MKKYQEKLKTDQYTLEDVITSLKKPNLDPRDEMPQPLLRSDILEIDDLKVGMKLQGTVRNVVDFGAFIELAPGIDALLHVSQIAKEHIEKPSDILKIGQEIEAKVVDFNEADKKISLSMKALLAPEEESVEEAPAEASEEAPAEDAE